jgi:hypothetical protein
VSRSYGTHSGKNESTGGFGLFTTPTDNRGLHGYSAVAVQRKVKKFWSTKRSTLLKFFQFLRGQFQVILLKPRHPFRKLASQKRAFRLKGIFQHSFRIPRAWKPEEWMGLGCSFFHCFRRETKGKYSLLKISTPEGPDERGQAGNPPSLWPFSRGIGNGRRKGI